MKTKEECNVLKKEAEVPENKLADLNEEKLALVTGGVMSGNNDDILSDNNDGDPFGSHGGILPGTGVLPSNPPSFQESNLPDGDHMD